MADIQQQAEKNQKTLRDRTEAQRDLRRRGRPAKQHNAKAVRRGQSESSAKENAEDREQFSMVAMPIYSNAGL